MTKLSTWIFLALGLMFVVEQWQGSDEPRRTNPYERTAAK